MSRVDELFAKINKKAGYQLASSGVSWEPMECIPFTSLRLQYLTYGGIRLGTITEFSGAESGGKTTTALDIVANAQRLYPDRDVLFIDVERTLDPLWSHNLGVDVDKLKYIAPREEAAEQIFQMVLDLLEDEETDISLIIIDSLAAMVSKQAYEKDMEGATYGGISKPLTTFSNKVAPLLRKKNTALIAINQVRDDMNSMYGGTTTPGGRAWKHGNSLRLEFRRADFFDESGKVVSTQAENPAGHYIKVLLKKTKVCKPNRKIGFYALNYIEGIDKYLDLIDVGVKLKVISQSGAWYYIADENGERKGFQGKSKLSQALREDDGLYNLQRKRVEEIILEDNVIPTTSANLEKINE